MIRLRQLLDTGLRHPVLGPLLAVGLALVLVLAVLHTLEHGLEGLLFTCAVLAATVLRLVVVIGALLRVAPPRTSQAGRGPPPSSARRFIQATRPPGAFRALPLRR